MRKIKITLLLLCLVSINAQTQEKLSADSILLNDSFSLSQDSLENSFLAHQTELIVSSMFGESRKLNNADSLINHFDALPSFGIYKDNYVVTGSEMFKKTDKWNSDAKFQVSIRQRLTNSTLPFKTYLFLTYTQKAFWDIYRESFPFRDLNFNPTLGIGRALIYNNRLLGALSFQFEHESNGKDGDDSRSWNKMTFSNILNFDDNWSLRTKVWIPISDGENNKDIVNYSGWGELGIDYMSTKKKYAASCVITKRAGSMVNANVTLNFAVRLLDDDNQYFFVEYYNGYGESMLEYKQHRNRMRVGIVIKPNFLNLY